MGKTDRTTQTVDARVQRAEAFNTLLERRISRRMFVKGTALTSAGVAAASTLGHVATTSAAPVKAPVGFTVIEPQPADTDEVVVPDGYSQAVLIRWGDPIMEGAPEFDPENQTEEAQEQQFGYNNDMLAFFPLPEGSDSSDNGLLVVNHEISNPELMFPEFDFENPTQEQVDVQLACQGISVVEIERASDGTWSYVQDSQYNRRITSKTEMDITGPAAGHDWLKTSEDSTGTTVAGTLNNCAGGWTPWGTYLSAEENWHQYFANADSVEDEDLKEVYDRYGIPEGVSQLKFEDYYDRFDISKEVNEVNRFGWMVEVNPYDPESTPKKRTALGRFRHEAGTCVVAPDDRVVCYTGDDARFEYMYKFVTDGTYTPDDAEANADLLDEGILYVAKFNEDGTGEWLPLVQGEGPLTEDNGFATQGDVVLKTRLAADALEATPMDRPEDAEVNPSNNKLYIMLTNNSRREEANAANPRTPNNWGHVIELTEDDDDHTSTTFTWEILLLCGPPDDESTDFAGYDKTKVSPIASPDNCTYDNQGNLWIATDGQSKEPPDGLGFCDALHMVPVEGSERGHVQQFASVPAGSETCGPLFTPDNTSLFIAVQHPGEGGTYEDPVSTWPDGKSPPRPSVVAIIADDGSPIGQASTGTAEEEATPLPSSGLGFKAPGVWVAAAGVAAAAAGVILRRRNGAKS
jgi:hypothetical protein